MENRTFLPYMKKTSVHFSFSCEFNKDLRKILHYFDEKMLS